MRLLFLWLPLAACTLPTAQAGDSPAAARIAAAHAVYDTMLAAHAAGAVPLDDVYLWSVRWHQAQKEAGEGEAGAAHRARMEALSRKVDEAVAAGVAPARDLAAMRYYVAEAKVWAP
jgi:hypothetical protein